MYLLCLLKRCIFNQTTLLCVCQHFHLFSLLGQIHEGEGDFPPIRRLLRTIQPNLKHFCSEKRIFESKRAGNCAFRQTPQKMHSWKIQVFLTTPRRAQTRHELTTLKDSVFRSHEFPLWGLVSFSFPFKSKKGFPTADNHAEVSV